MTIEAELPPRNHNAPPELLPVFPPEPTAEAVAEAIAPAEGGGSAPLPYDAELHAKLRIQSLAFADACGKWRDLKTIVTAEQADKLTDFISGARGLAKKVEEARKAEKKVWDDKGAAVHKAFVALTDILTRAADSVKPLQADWLKREQDRINAEQAEKRRLAAEAAAEADRLAAQAAARNDVVGEAEAEKAAKEAAKLQKVADRDVRAKAGSATGGGRAMSLRTVKTANIVSQNGVYMHFREHPRVREVLQALANEAVRAGVEFPENILTVKTDKVAA